MNMPEYIKERCELAVAYAEDGAYVSAHKVLKQLTADVDLHVEALRGEGLLPPAP